MKSKFKTVSKSASVAVFILFTVYSLTAVAQPRGIEVKSFGDKNSFQSKNSAPVLVVVRLVKAFERYEQAPLQHYADRIDARLADLSPQLEKLPFRRFSFVGGDRRVIPMRGKQVIPLKGGQSVVIRPLYFESNKFGMALKWMDSAGDAILDTRMYFDPGESMLAGTDSLSGPEDGVLLAVTVDAGQ